MTQTNEEAEQVKRQSECGLWCINCFKPFAHFDDGRWLANDNVGPFCDECETLLKCEIVKENAKCTRSYAIPNSQVGD